MWPVLRALPPRVKCDEFQVAAALGCLVGLTQARKTPALQLTWRARAVAFQAYVQYVQQHDSCRGRLKRQTGVQAAGRVRDLRMLVISCQQRHAGERVRCWRREGFGSVGQGRLGKDVMGLPSTAG